VSELEHTEIKNKVIGYVDGILIADKDLYKKTRYLLNSSGKGAFYRWRSGIKHDCSAVMEFMLNEKGIAKNGLNENSKIEENVLYPMLKGSEVAGGRIKEPRRLMLVTQKEANQDTRYLKKHAPNAWKYLVKHDALLNGRKSVIYKNRPKFSIFGIGGYSFSPWKVAICGMYKKIEFVPVGSYGKKPIMLDDTCYYISCETKAEAELLSNILNSDVAKEFFEAFVFWDSKRPVTVELLGRLDILTLAEELGVKHKLLQLRPEIKEQSCIDFGVTAVTNSSTIAHYR
jgi:hypothetical protein